MRNVAPLLAGLVLMAGCLKIQEQTIDIDLNLDGTGRTKLRFNDISSDETNAASAAAEIEDLYADYRKGKYHEMYREMGLHDVSVTLERDTGKRLNGTVEGGFSNIWTMARVLGVENVTTDTVVQVSLGGGRLAFRLHDKTWTPNDNEPATQVTIRLLDGTITKANGVSISPDRKTAVWTHPTMATNGIAFEASLPAATNR